jgi:ribosome biogenesis GTPase
MTHAIPLRLAAPGGRGRSRRRGPGSGRGRLASCDEAGGFVATAAGRLRATWGPAVLAHLAADPAAVPRAGDEVEWFRWPDGRVTVEQVLPDRRP